MAGDESGSYGGGAVSEEVTVQMPLHITHEMLLAVKSDPLTKYEDKDKMNHLIGWLVCAYDVMVKTRLEE